MDETADLKPRSRNDRFSANLKWHRIALMAAEANRLLRRKGLDQEEFMLVMVIGWGSSDNNPFDISSLSRFTGVPRSSLQRTIIKLKRDGIIQTTSDGSRQLLILTEFADTHPAGRRLMTQVETIVDRAFADIARLK